MIRYSSNSATNKLIDVIGKRAKRSYRPTKVERVLKSYSPGLFRQTSIVEYIPRGGKTYRNAASAHDYSRFLYAMWNDNLPLADELKYYMGYRIKIGLQPRCRLSPSRSMFMIKLAQLQDCVVIWES